MRKSTNNMKIVDKYNNICYTDTVGRGNYMRMLPPDAPLGHLKAADIPAQYARMIQAGAKIPAGILGGSLPEETENLRVYLDGAFWGIMHRNGSMLEWKAQIAPEKRESETKSEPGR